MNGQKNEDEISLPALVKTTMVGELEAPPLAAPLPLALVDPELAAASY